MTAAIFGLVGVIVGAVMQGGAAWFMERRRKDWAARKAGRLMARALTRCRFILKAGHDGAASWGMIAVEINEALARWPEHSDLLAGTIKRDEDWNGIVGAVESLQRIEQRGHAGPLDAEVSTDDREFLGYIGERVWGARLHGEHDRRRGRPHHTGRAPWTRLATAPTAERRGRGT